jgi:hypothetical protein
VFAIVVFGIWYLVFGIWYLVCGIWYKVFSMGLGGGVLQSFLKIFFLNWLRNFSQSDVLNKKAHLFSPLSKNLVYRITNSSL